MNHTNAREVAELAAKIIAPTYVIATDVPFLEGWLDMKKALEWYETKVRDCRKITSDGDIARHDLDSDGGKRARIALEKARGKE